MDSPRGPLWCENKGDSFDVVLRYRRGTTVGTLKAANSLLDFVAEFAHPSRLSLVELSQEGALQMR
jgi:hypothetical protein